MCKLKKLQKNSFIDRFGEPIFSILGILGILFLLVYSVWNAVKISEINRSTLIRPATQDEINATPMTTNFASDLMNDQATGWKVLDSFSVQVNNRKLNHIVTFRLSMPDSNTLHFQTVSNSICLMRWQSSCRLKNVNLTVPVGTTIYIRVGNQAMLYRIDNVSQWSHSEVFSVNE